MSFASGIRLIVVGLVAATAALVAVVVFWGFGSLLNDVARESLAAIVNGRCERLVLAVDVLQRDTVLAAQFCESAQASALESEGLETERKTRLADEFRALLLSNPEYLQARWIGLAGEGLELVRVDHLPTGIQRVAEADLQSKGTRDYFLDALAQGPGHTSLSEVNLNREHGQVEVPHRPVLRASRVVMGPDGEVSGVVVINVDFEVLLDRLFRGEQERVRLFLANAEGDFLFHPDRSKTYGFDLGFEYRVQDEFPDLAPLPTEVGQGLTEEVAAVGDEASGLVHFERVRLAPGHDLFVGMLVSQASITGTLRWIEVRAVGLAAILILLALLGAYVFSARLTRPLHDIARAAGRIARGAENVDLPVEADNEAGEVARALRRMLAALSEKEQRLVATGAELREANADLEHFAHVASHDLREPARRIVGLVDLLELEDASQLTDEARNLIALAKDEAAQMLAQISDLRILVGIGEGVLVRKPLALDALVLRVLQEFDQALTERGVEVTVGALPALDAYESLVLTLYRNLILNTLQHAQEGPFALRIGYELAAGGPILSVWNSGSTIPAARRFEIFEPFITLDRARRSGLGLSICKRIAERHAGRIWVESGADFTQFLFTLSPETQ